jgi:ribose-phosphate pyrophosphokinase
MITVNGHELKPTIFPDGTSQVWHLPDELFWCSVIHVDWRFGGEREIIDLLSLRALLPKQKMTLHVPYLPFARQDKPVSNDATFNLHVLAELLNMLVFVDVHNPVVTKTLIDNLRNISVSPIHANLIRDVNPDCVVFADAGAEARYTVKDKPKITYYKDRDQATGRLKLAGLSYHPLQSDRVHNPDLSLAFATGAQFLIIDDICDGGATFIEIAKNLRDALPMAKIDLFVTHGLFSRGMDPLRDAGIDKIYTTNSLPFNKEGYKV